MAVSENATLSKHSANEVASLKIYKNATFLGDCF